MSSSASLERYLTLNPKSPQIPQILFLLPIIGRPENSCRYISRVFPSLVPEEAFKTPRRRVLVPPTRCCPALKGGPRLYFSKFQPPFFLLRSSSYHDLPTTEISPWIESVVPDLVLLNQSDKRSHTIPPPIRHLLQTPMRQVQSFAPRIWPLVC